MTQISSNATLFYKFFLPIFWIVLFGASTVAIWNISAAQLSDIRTAKIQLLATVLYFLGIFLFYLFTLRLKRVEIDTTHVYVTNYFKHIRYPHQDVEKIVENKRLVFPKAVLILKAKGSFGKKIAYIPIRGRLNDFLNEHPKVALQLEWK